MSVENRNDLHFVGFEQVTHNVWKSPHKGLADTSIGCSVKFRCRANSLPYFFDAVQELKTKPGPLFFIPTERRG